MRSWLRSVSLKLPAPAAGLGLALALCLVLAPPSGQYPPTVPAPANSLAAPNTTPLPRAWTSPTPVALPSLAAPTIATIAAAAPQQPTARPGPTVATATPPPGPSAPAAPTPSPVPTRSAPTRLVIAAIGLDTTVVTVSITETLVAGQLERVWQVADGAAGYHEGTAFPGDVGNTVITGHNNIHGKVFRDLDKLQPGDEVVLWAGRNVYRYVVSASFRVRVHDATDDEQRQALRWIEPTTDERLTLVTCWPLWSNTHRTIVVALPAGVGASTPPD